MSDLTPVERKRLRDRRAQRTLRTKKLNHAAELEAKIAHCEQYHNDQGVQQLLAIIRRLRKQKEDLLQRQKSLKSLVNSWDEEQEDSLTSNQWLSQGTQKETNATARPNPKNSGSGVAGYCAVQKELSSMRIDSPWNQLPLYFDDFSDPTKASCPWFLYPEKTINCPNTPESPLDILYGSKTNPLANMIHLALERRPIRDPERLAMGWIAYHFSRWILSPSQKTYERLPHFLRPVDQQLRTEHPIALSFIPWSQMRVNLIRQWPLYAHDRDGLFGLFGCCIKIRWPWGLKVLERNAENVLCIKPAFYELFMKEEGWGITPEFLSKYPNLMTGIDVESIVFTVA